MRPFPLARCGRNFGGRLSVLRALRVTYVGELGWELHMPVDVAVTVYEALMAAGADLGLMNAGYRAIETLRLEKGLSCLGRRYWTRSHAGGGGAGLGLQDEVRREFPGAARRLRRKLPAG